jgi:hypothetical protein
MSTQSFATKSYVNFVIEDTEMLRIEPDGFYVRGRRVCIPEQEALEVYNSFNQWLTWAQLQQKNG